MVSTLAALEVAVSCEQYTSVPHGFEHFVNDHRIVEGLLAGLENAGSPSERSVLLSRLREEHLVHSRAEAQALYAVCVQRRSLAMDMRSCLDMHGEVDEILDELAGLAGDGSGWDKSLGELVQLMREHIFEEEQELFPELFRQLDHDQLEELQREFVTAKAAELSRLHTPAEPVPSPCVYWAGRPEAA